MKKLTMAVAVSTLALAANSYAAVYNYNTSGVNTGVDVDVSSGTTTITYDPNPLTFTGDWTFDISGTSATLSGDIYLGDYAANTSVSVPFLGSMSGSPTYTDANHAVSGTGSWNVGTRTLTYTLASSGPNTSNASNFTFASSSCTGSGSILNNTVCGTWANTTGDWEGLSLTFVFASDMSSFTGTISAIEQSGSGLTANTTTIDFDIDGTQVSEVPVPAAAWLFGSALLGLGGLKRRKMA